MSSDYHSAVQSVSNRQGFQSLCLAQMPRCRYAGFTLVEMAIVLMVIGLMIGGVLQGQALLENARVRALMRDISSIETAWYAFEDRYHAVPGDFPHAPLRISQHATAGNGNSRVDSAAERSGVWQQLALAGLISGQYDGEAQRSGSASDVLCAMHTCPQNPYHGFYKVSYSAQAAGAGSPAWELFTGAQIPVAVLARLDAKLDDGDARQGRLRVHRAFAASCAVQGQWNVSGKHTNCAGVLRH